MKRLICLIGLIFLLTGCNKKSNLEFEFDVQADTSSYKVTTYVYSIHTRGGLSDTIEVHKELKCYLSYGCTIIHVDELNTKYYYVDKIELIKKNIKIIE